MQQLCQPIPFIKSFDFISSPGLIHLFTEDVYNGSKYALKGYLSLLYKLPLHTAIDTIELTFNALYKITNSWPKFHSNIQHNIHTEAVIYKITSIQLELFKKQYKQWPMMNLLSLIKVQ